MEEKKNNKALEITIYIALILISGIIAFTIIQNKKQANEEQTTKQEETVIEEPKTEAEPEVVEKEDTTPVMADTLKDTSFPLISEEYMKDCIKKVNELQKISSYEEYEALVNTGEKHIFLIGRDDNVYCNAFSVVLKEILDRYELNTEVYYFDTTSYKTAIEKEEQAGIDDGDARKNWNLVKENLGVSNSIPTVLIVEGETKAVWDSEAAQETYKKTYGTDNDDILKMGQNIALQAYMKESFLSFITENN